MTRPADRAATRRLALVDELREAGITDDRVLAAMATVPRDRFVASGTVDDAYGDQPLPIAGGQTISAPSMVARMTQALELRGHETVLEVGTGSGYGAAVLAACAAEVVSLEYDEDLVVGARRSLAAAGVGNVEVRHADGALGAPDRAPFEAISITAMAPEPPQALLEQLAPGGTLVAPLGPGREGTLVRSRDGRQEDLGPVRFVAMRGRRS